MTDLETRAPSVLDMVFGYTAAQMLNVAARLEIADRLAAGAMTSAELAAAARTDGPAMYRLLRGLACFGVVIETGPDLFTLGPAGESLRADAPHSVRAMVMLLCADETWRSWGQLEYSVRTGQPAWEKVTGVSNFEYLASNPQKSAEFNAAMAEYTRAAVPGILSRYDFSRLGNVVDVGGGDGTLLAELLRAVPGLRGTVFDLPAGVETARQTLAAAGVTDRSTVVSGDFFDTVPDGADGYLLKSVLHDWDDKKAVEILTQCRKAMAPGGVVLTIEPVLPPTVTSPAVIGVVMSDLNMLVNTGGRERTEAEFGELYAAAGLTLTSISGQEADFCVIEGRAS